MSHKLGFLFEYVNHDGSFLFLTRRVAYSLLGLIAAASEGKRAPYRRRWENYVAVTFAIIHLTCLKSRLCGQARGLGLPGRLTSGKTVKFRAFLQPQGASLFALWVVCSHYPRGVQRESSALALLTQPYCFFILNKVYMRVSRGPWLTQRGQGPTAWYYSTIKGQLYFAF